MKRRIFSLLLVLAMLCSLLPQFTLPARAQDPYSGSCGPTLSWRFDPDSGKLSIEGSGAMNNFSTESAPWYAYREAITAVSLPEGLTSIGLSAFSDCSSLTSVTIPDSVKKIGFVAFGWNGEQRVEGFTIYGTSGSAAQSYAEDHGFLFGVLNPPVITKQPKSVGAELGDSVSFQVPAFGSDLRYQWQYKKMSATGSTIWSNSAGQTSASISFKSTASHNGTQLRCVVSNAVGSVISEVATLTLLRKPTITTQPQSATVENGKSVTLSVAATGGNLSYQWQYQKAGETGWTTWAGKTSASLKLVGSDTNNGCRYRCVVSNAKGSVISNPATLTLASKLKGKVIAYD